MMRDLRKPVAWLVLVLGLGGIARAEIIDRILAVVDNNLIIMLSDVSAVRRLGVIAPSSQGDPIAATMERLIDRGLMLIEVERYSPPEPDQAAIDAGVAAVRSRFADQSQFERVLVETGMTPDQLRRYIRDDLRLETYLDQRFGAMLVPADSEIVQYYRDHPAEFTRNEVLLPFSDVAGSARAKLIAERRAALIREWLAGLRRRAEVNVLYVPVAGGR
jgi:hypothetical protein